MDQGRDVGRAGEKVKWDPEVRAKKEGNMSG